MGALATYFVEGGWAMYVILVVFALEVAIFIERLIFLFIRCSINAKGVLTEVKKLINSDRVPDARKLCAKSKAPLAAILEAALYHYEQGLTAEEIQNGVDETALRELPKIGKRVQWLSLLANVSTLTGLLGTITGLITSFGALATADPSQKSTLLALGISQAMNTTAFGLISAIPGLVAYTFLQSKSSTIVEEIDESTVRLLNHLFVKKRLDN